jgi:hypothetical protein
MRALQLPAALLALVGMIAALPAMAHFTTAGPAEALGPVSQVLAALAVPVIALLLVSSWVQPGGGG